MSPSARIPPATVEVYAVIRADGMLKKTQYGGLAIYTTKPVAQRQCRADGDAVVLVTIDLGNRPVFIRGELVDGGS